MLDDELFLLWFQASPTEKETNFICASIYMKKILQKTNLVTTITSIITYLLIWVEQNQKCRFLERLYAEKMGKNA